MKHFTIKCPNCGAPLNVLGGRNIQSVVCEYCGSVIDLTDDYKIVSKFRKSTSKLFPLELGMQGDINHIKFTVIGYVGYASSPKSRVAEWIDFALHSPIYGYAWLTYENGVFVFSRRIRKTPVAKIWQMDKGDSFKFEGRKYRVYEGYRSYVVSAGGSLTYLAKQGDSIYSIEAISPPYGIAYEHSEDEIEYYKMEYIPSKDIYESFGIKGTPKEEGFNALKPFKAPMASYISKVAFVFFIISIIAIYMLHTKASGNLILYDYIKSANYQKEITISKTAPYLTEVYITTTLNNTYRDFSLSLYDSSKNIVYQKSFEISYYHGYDDGEYWTEGSRVEDIYIPVKKSGKYILNIVVAGYKRGDLIKLELIDGVLRSRYFIILAVLSLLGMLAYPFAYLKNKGVLWGDSDDED